MCLRINTNIHPDWDPLVAEDDIFVVKGLVRYLPAKDLMINEIGDRYVSLVCAPHYYTPFMLTRIVFIDDKCTLVEKDFGKDIRDGEVRLGIHSLSHKAYVEGFRLNGYAADDNETVCYFPAIIPKGTLYFKGVEGDFVSEKLDIYQYLPEKIGKNAVEC